MSKVDCESLLGAATESFKRTEDSTETVLAYDEESIHLEVDSEGVVVLVSAFQPREVFLDGIQLLGRPLNQIAEALSSAGVQFEENDVGLWCDQAGVNIVVVDDIVDGVELSA
ncbi:hypothetical protein [Marinobacter sp. HN1S83]|uniref:hypothetical protein n=1 Tax=Marinobacter sp. HN1S83 TaxID=3382301 RepID=UPI00387AE148